MALVMGFDEVLDADVPKLRLHAIRLFVPVIGRGRRVSEHSDGYFCLDFARTKVSTTIWFGVLDVISPLVNVRRSSAVRIGASPVWADADWQRVTTCTATELAAFQAEAQMEYRWTEWTGEKNAP